MPPRNWNRLFPATQQEAIRLCLDHAKEKRNLSVAGVAARLGTTEWAVYKWLAKGGMPSEHILGFEFVCGIDYVTRYLAHAGHKLLIDIPTGRRTGHKELAGLSIALNETLGLLMKFHEGQAEADETLGAITAAMEDLAWHRGTVQKSAQPEFDFEGGN